MSKNCKDAVKGSLGQYCALLMTQNDYPPFCDHGEATGTACIGWDAAQKVSVKKLTKPTLENDLVKCDALYAIDYLLSGKKILCVEDNMVNMKVLVKSLGGLEQLVLKAKNGQEALDHIASGEPVGLVLLDLDMPIMNGTEFIEKVSDMYGDVLPFKVVIVSELKNYAHTKNLIEHGASSQVQKPYQTSELLEAIKMVLF